MVRPPDSGISVVLVGQTVQWTSPDLDLCEHFCGESLTSDMIECLFDSHRADECSYLSGVSVRIF